MGGGKRNRVAFADLPGSGSQRAALANAEQGIGSIFQHSVGETDFMGKDASSPEAKFGGMEGSIGQENLDSDSGSKVDFDYFRIPVIAS